MGGGEPIFCALGLSDYFDFAGGAGEATVLSQLLWATRAAHLAGVFAGVGRGLFEFGLVYRSTGSGGDQGRAVVGLHLFCAEPFSP